MGGMISQLFAIHYPERTRSLVSIMSTTGDSSLPQAPMSVNLALLKGPGATEEEVVHFSLEKFRTISRCDYKSRGAEMRTRRESEMTKA